MMRVGSLCTGYGGIELGLMLAGVDVDLRWFAEIDQDVATVVEKHDTWVPNVGDITRADWSAVEPIDLLTMGVPCQPVSAAGKRKGTADARWLWPAALAAVRHIGPARVLFENVRNLVSYDKGRLWAGILADLTDLGYDVRWLTLGACHVGAAHHRHRVFALAERRRWVPGRVERVPTSACGVGRQGARSVVGQMLPTPNAALGRSTGFPSEATATDRWGRGNRFLDDAVALLPTPAAVSYGSNQGGAAGRVGPVRHSLESMARLDLPPTPTARDGDGRGEGDAEYWAAHRRSNGIPLGAELALLPEHWGRFAGAVARHESLYGPAPAPTEPNRNGAPRLAAPFAEWLMCLPAGHVTDVLARVPALRAIGNGVCPPQLAAAWALLTGSTGNGGA